MNKKDIALIIGVILIILVSIFAIGGNGPKVELPLVLSGEDTGTIKIDYPSYKAKVENKENFLVVIERTGCSYCEMYMPILENATQELSIPVYYIDTAELTEEEYNELETTNSYLKRNNWGTPTTLLMSGNIVVDSISGYVEQEEFIEQIIDKNIKLSQEENTDVE